MPRLSDMLAKIYDRTQRKEAASQHRVLLLVHNIDEFFSLKLLVPPDGWSVVIPTEGYWAPSEQQWNPSVNLRWGEGMWA